MYYSKIIETGWFVGPIMTIKENFKYQMNISINANPIIEIYPQRNYDWIIIEVYL